MKVKYVGHSGSGVEVIHPDPESPDTNTVTVCLPGETVDLSDGLALGAMVVGNFEPADTKAKSALARYQREAEASAQDSAEPATDETPAEPGTQED